jgi:beta-glucanase (GH16 family)
MRFSHLALIGALLLMFSSCRSIFSGKNRLELVWADEFKDTDPPDGSKWNYDLGTGRNGWGNNEEQYYTDRPENVRQLNGRLFIEAHKEDYEGSGYTSARLVTRGKQSWGPGHRILVRAKLPSGRGTWPAIWTLGDNLPEVGWPLCGEIDIMEHVGYHPDSVFATVHTAVFNHVDNTQTTIGVAANDLETNFHDYGIDWYDDRIEFTFDGRIFYTFRKVDNATEREWPFDKPQHLLLNLAVGGNWGGKKGIDDTIWPQRMEVDWVRVFKL